MNGHGEGVVWCVLEIFLLRMYVRSYCCYSLYVGLHSSQLIGFELFSYFYQQLPPDHTDLATRWTDYNQQTLLYRLEPRHSSLILLNTQVCSIRKTPLK